MSEPRSLAWHHARLLALAFMAVEVVALVLFVVLTMLPMARQSADDLAGLMVLSAQTWAELPPDTRPAFEVELRQGHALRVRPAAQVPPTQGPQMQEPVPGPSRWQPPFFQMLASSLNQRLHADVRVTAQVGDDGATTYWARLPAGSGVLEVGVSDDRINTRPVLAPLLALLLGAVVAVALAWWLSRRVVEPLARLQRATAEVGQGELPTLLPEEGPLEVVLLSRRFNAMAVQVQALVAARTTLLAGVSHDLRTPLARIRLALELLRVKPTPSLLDRLDQDVTHMNDIIGNVLDLARGLAHEPPVAVDVLALLQGMAQDHSTAACQVQVTCPPCVLPLPRVALHRALNNLLENAMRYAPVCPVELRCEATATGCRLGVLDRGPGIAPHDVQAMFQPFQRMEASRSPATGGRGLGLAIVRELCLANGWQVSLVAREGGGMAAWLDLPNPPERPGSPAFTPAPATPPGSRPSSP